MEEKKLMRLLFVCLGNICRSPAAEAIMKALVASKQLSTQFLIDSAGTYGGHNGALPDERMRRHASKRGYNLDSRARQIYPTADFANFDLIICMDNSNYTKVRGMAITDEERGKVVRMMDYAVCPTNYKEVPDPYYEGADGFELVLDLLEDTTRGLLVSLYPKIEIEN